MNVHRSTRRRAVATLAATVIAYAGIAVAAVAPASAGEPGHCDYGACGVIHNEGTVPIGVFNNWDRPVPGEPDTGHWNQYAQNHKDTTYAAIWDYWSTHVDSDGMTAKLLPVGADSQSLGAQFKDVDGFYIGKGMRAIVDVGSISHTCVIGPIYYQVHGYWPTVSVYSGPSVC